MTHSPERRAAIESLISKWREVLTLGDWDIRLSDDPPDHNCRGNTNAWRKKRAAMVRIHYEAPGSALEEIVVHELLHIVFWPWWDPVDDLLSRYMSPDTLSAVKVCLDDEEEIVIQRITRGFLGPTAGTIVWDPADPWIKAFGLKEE